MKYIIGLVGMLLSSLSVNAQEVTPGKTLSGKVISASNDLPVQGATLTLLNQHITVYTDASGIFSIPLFSSNEVLTISHVGFLSKKISLSQNTSSPFIIILQDSSIKLDEVVVNTGYQNIPKERATGSFVTVNNELLNNRVAPDIISKLEGITSGLVFFKGVPNRPAEINIRGQSTLFSNTQPLIVVDNFPYDGDINTINPNDVASITVLKDAAAASIWGVRAGNGVIVITTKKGKFNRPLQVSFNSNITVGQKPDLFYDRNFLSSADFIDVESFLFSKGFFNADFTARDKRPVSPVVDILHRQQLGSISQQEALAEIDKLKQFDIRNDLQKYFYQQSVNTQYSLSLEGGGEKVNYFFSGGYDKGIGNSVGSSTDRVTLHSLDVFRPLPRMELSISIDYISSRSKQDITAGQISMGGRFARAIYPYASLADGAGSPVPIVKDYNSTFVQQATSNGFLNWQFQPLDELRSGYNITSSKSYETRIATGLKYDFLKGFNGEIRFQYENSLPDVQTLHNEQSYYARNIVNMYSAVSPGHQFLNYVIPPGGILDQLQNNLTSYSIRGQVNYNRVYKNNTIDVIAGVEQRQISTDGKGDRIAGYNDDLGTFALVDPVTYYTIYPSGYSMLIPVSQSISGTLDRYRSFFANGAFSYKHRYTFSASGRIDGSNYFGVATNKKNVPLWSSGFKWNVDNENFYHITWLPSLKTRVTYGYNGNLNKSITAFTTGQYNSNDFYTNQPYLTISSPPNKNLRWEKTAMLNLGIDFATKEDFISGSIEYFYKRGTDIIGDNALAPSTGFLNLNFNTNTVKGNYADMKGHGWDIQLNSKNISRGFTWSTQFLFSYATDKVTHYGGTNPSSQLVNYGNGANGFVIPNEGKPVYGIYSLRWAGLDPSTGDPQGYLNDAISKNYARLANPVLLKDIEYNGPARPQFYGALGNRFSWKHFTLFCNLTFKLGYYFRRSSVNYYNLFYYYTANSDYSARWQKPGDEAITQVPSLMYPANSSRDIFYNSSSVLVEKGDHIRIQNISLNYDFDTYLRHKLPINHLQLYGYINNAGIIWRANKKGLDPDYPTGIHAPRTYSIGLRASF